MDENTRIDYAKYRIEKARKCLETAKNEIQRGDYETATNRSYYAMFHAVRNVLAMDEVDFKRHSGVIGYFRKEYVKTGIFPMEMSDMIGDAFEARGGSDYNDFYAISKERVDEQISNAEQFVRSIEIYLDKRIHQAE